MLSYFDETTLYMTAYRRKLLDLEEQHSQVKETHEQTEKQLLGEKASHEMTRLQFQNTSTAYEKTKQELEGNAEMYNTMHNTQDFNVCIHRRMNSMQDYPAIIDFPVIIYGNVKIFIGVFMQLMQLYPMRRFRCIAISMQTVLIDLWRLFIH